MRGYGRILGTGVAGLLVLGSFVPALQALDQSQWKQRRPSLEEQPVQIRADRMELRRQDNLILYTGNVSVIQPQYRLDSDLLEVRWDPDSRKIRYLVAKGKVRMEAEDAKASCGVAVLDVEAQSVEMYDSPKMRQGGEHVEGERIVYLLNEKRSTVLGGRGGRVRTLVIPGGKK